MRITLWVKPKQTKTRPVLELASIQYKELKIDAMLSQRSPGSMCKKHSHPMGYLAPGSPPGFCWYILTCYSDDPIKLLRPGYWCFERPFKGTPRMEDYVNPQIIFTGSNRKQVEGRHHRLLGDAISVR